MKNKFDHREDGTTCIYYTSKKTGLTLETIIDTEDFDKVNKLKGTWFISLNRKNDGFRVKGKIDGKNIYLYRLILGIEDNRVVQHIDGDTLNNKKSNLRVLSHKESLQRQKCRGKLPRNVIFNPRDNKYRVRIFKDGKKISFGQYNTIEEADEVAQEARKKLMPYSIL